jgi:hypothetical protein
MEILANIWMFLSLKVSFEVPNFEELYLTNQLELDHDPLRNIGLLM